MRTVVTGATGFLGRHLIERLIAGGHDLCALVRSPDEQLAAQGVSQIEGGLDDTEAIAAACEGARYVFHLAGKVTRDPRQTHQMYSLHVDGTRRLLEALVGSQVEKVIVASTSGTVGVGTEEDFLADESSPTAEVIVRNWPYYLSKIYAERLCQDFIREHDLPIVLMRPTLLLGPGDVRESSTADVIRFLKRRIPSVVSGGLSFVDVRDVADAFVAALNGGQPGDTFLLGAENLKVSEFFTRLERLSGVKGPKLELADSISLFGAKILESAYRAVGKESELDSVSVDMARHYWYIDSSYAVEKLDFAPRPGDETLRDTIQWIRENHADFVGTDTVKRRSAPEEFVTPEMRAFADELAGRSPH